MLFKLSNLNSNLALTLGYLNPALNNSAQPSNNWALEMRHLFFAAMKAIIIGTWRKKTQVCKLHVGPTQIIGFALYCYIITQLFMGSLSWGNTVCRLQVVLHFPQG